MFDTFYNIYIKYKHYVNDILSAISHNDEINSQNKINNQEHKIRLLELELENLKNENTKLKEDNKSQLKIVELLSRNEGKNIKNTQNNNTEWMKSSKKGSRFPTFNSYNLFTVLDHQPGNLETDLSEEDAPNILNTIDLSKANSNDKRRPNICISEKYIENYEIPIRTAPEKPHISMPSKIIRKRLSL